MESSPKRAYTLLEILVAMSLMLLVFGAALYFFFPSLRDSTRTQVRIELQQLAVSATYKLIADLETCTPSGIGISQLPPGGDPNVNPGGSMVGLQPVVDLTAEVPPAPVFDSVLTVYWWEVATGTLLRWNGVPGQISLSASTPHRCTTQELLDLVKGAGKKSRICQDVKSFSVESPAAPPAVGLPLKLRLVVERQAVSGQSPEKYEIHRSVSLRMA